MNQAALPLDWPPNERETDFIIGEGNAAAVRHLDRWATWPVMATILIGPRKSGRSLLGRIFAAKSGGRLIDDAERRGEDELFHAWNRAQEERRPLLLIADRAPPEWRARLPDLASRLAATPVALIGDPDDSTIARLLEKLLGHRGLILPADLVAYLLPRAERSHISVMRLVDALDQAALSKRSRLTLPLVRGVLEDLGMAERIEAGEDDH